MNHLQFTVTAGTLALTWNGKGILTRLDWYDHPKSTGRGSGVSRGGALGGQGIPPVVMELWTKMQPYFESGEPLGAIPWNLLDLSGCTEFQRKVYEAIAAIPHGETRTYSWVAARLRQFNASRAVGQALKKNPFPIVIPCHRVVAAQAMGGFMGVVDPNEPEMVFKKTLLEIENRYLNPVFPFLLAGYGTDLSGGDSWQLAAG